MIPILRSKFSRPAGAPIFGKRTERMETSVSALTKQLCQEEAKRSGFATVADWQHSVITHIVHRKHATTVFAVEHIVNENNSGNSRGEA